MNKHLISVVWQELLLLFLFPEEETSTEKSYNLFRNFYNVPCYSNSSISTE